MWFLFAFTTALLTSINDVIRKQTSHKIDVYTIAWGMRFFSLFFLVPLLLIKGIPAIHPPFFLALIVSSIILTITTILYNKAIQISDLSLTTPMLTLSPMFLLITSPLILGEFPTQKGLLGIILIVAGSYILNIREGRRGYLAPFKAILKDRENRGPRLMLIVAIMFSVGSNMDKIGVVNSSPIFWVVAVNTVCSVLLFPIMLWRTQNVAQKIKREFKFLGLIGFLDAVALITQMIALTLTIVPYVIAVKRTSVLMSSIWGFLIFKEKGVKERLVGTILMILGLILIVVG